ncbi:MAG: GNAT family N-acetyltransferase [Planctomycetes bacterium]|nr:GNAT family N-acetyltransferase [Planctomycetota bacterium]
MQERSLEMEDRVYVRNLRPDDLEAVIHLDFHVTGIRRDEFYKVKLSQALAGTGIEVSLAAEIEGIFCGFLLARVFYGEFGVMEQVAVLDTIAVHPDFQNQGAGDALLGQLKKNLRALGVPRLRTEVSWEDQELLGFFHREQFRPAPILCLEHDLTSTAPISYRERKAMEPRSS